MIRIRGKKVVLGGYHATALPEEAKKHADSVILGMAEANWPELLDDFEKGKLKSIYQRNTNFDMSKIPPLRRDLIKHNPLMGAVQSTRGCSNKCEFCAIGSFCHHGVKQRPIKNVIEEIDFLNKNYRVKAIKFDDDNFIVNPKRVIEICVDISVHSAFSTKPESDQTCVW